jgi:DNA mismatch repair protein MutS2
LNGNTYRTLEFEKIRLLLLSLAGSAPGQARIRALRPLVEAEAVRTALGLASQAALLLRKAGRQAYHELPDLAEALAAACVEGLHLEPAALLDVASFVEGSREIATRVAASQDAPTLARLAAGIADFGELTAAIRRAILPSREVADDASPRLAELRHTITRLRARLQSVLEAFLRSKDANRLLQEKLVTTRNDRYVLLLKAEHRGQIPGIIHGSSGSGASVFVEPMPAVELNNDIVELQDEERREVQRILRALTARVGRRAAELERACEILGELDAVQAKALLAREMDAIEPEIADALELDLVDARHPLLMAPLAERLGIPRRTSREPVPVSLRVGFADPVLVISGPNTGGKTVALKTVGLLAMMAQSGLHVPAAKGSRLPVFRRIYADIGDDQSIAENLSTFSAHLASIVEMTRDLAQPALVLLDEVGAGTDPTEGGALGVAIVDHFRAQGAMVVATTHHGLMKAYAQATPGVACASFGYDPASYEPSYRLALGVPGRSLALEMAERLGLPAEVVADARARLSQKEAQAEAMLRELEGERARLLDEAESLAAQRAALDADAAALRTAQEQLEARKRQELEAFARELGRRSEQAGRKAADAIREAVQRVEASRKSALNESARARSALVVRLREAQDEALHDLPVAPEPAAPPAALASGSRVRVRSLGVIGEVVTRFGSDVELAVGGKRMRVPFSELGVIGAPTAAATSKPAANLSAPARVQTGAGSAPAELNIVGLTVDEAIPRVDKFLDQAALAERSQVRVIHGFGQGRLRKAVAELLEGHPHVAGFRLGEGREGGAGATIVELKE